MESAITKIVGILTRKQTSLMLIVEGHHWHHAIIILLKQRVIHPKNGRGGSLLLAENAYKLQN